MISMTQTRTRFFCWKRSQPAIIRYFISTCSFLGVIAGRIAAIVSLFYLNYIAVVALVSWSISLNDLFGFIVTILMLLFSLAILKLDWMLAGSMMIGGWKCVAESLEINRRTS
ncbi:MAG: hypothetical protein AB7C98_00565 [Acidithiobacillus sp.]|jgi:hypothetical protein